MLVEFMTFELSVAVPINLGMRRCIPITGGIVSGAYSGTIMPGGADWQIVAPVPTARRSNKPRRSKVSAVELEIDGVAVKINRGADTAMIAAVIEALKATR